LPSTARGGQSPVDLLSRLLLGRERHRGDSRGSAGRLPPRLRQPFNPNWSADCSRRNCGSAPTRGSGCWNGTAAASGLRSGTFPRHVSSPTRGAAISTTWSSLDPTRSVPGSPATC